MNDGIIIEKDGKRYWFDDTTPIYHSFLEIVEAYKAHRCLKEHTLPPVIRTDNSNVIARLEAENAKIAKCLEEFMLATEMFLPVDVLEQYNRAKLVKRCREALKEAKKIGEEE